MKSNEAVRSFESFSEEFSRTRQKSWKEFSFLADAITHARSILDLGCGNGRLIPFLRSLNTTATYTGLDISPSLIAECTKTYPNETFVEGDMSDLPFSDSSFDLVIACASLHHVETPEKRRKVIVEVSRVLETDGLFTGFVWNLHQPKYWKYWSRSPWNMHDVFIPWKSSEEIVMRYYHAFNKQSLKGLLKLGLTPRSIFYVNGNKKSTILRGRNLFFEAENI